MNVFKNLKENRYIKTNRKYNNKQLINQRIYMLVAMLISMVFFVINFAANGLFSPDAILSLAACYMFYSMINSIDIRLIENKIDELLMEEKNG